MRFACQYEKCFSDLMKSYAASTNTPLTNDIDDDDSDDAN